VRRVRGSDAAFVEIGACCTHDPSQGTGRASGRFDLADVERVRCGARIPLVVSVWTRWKETATMRIGAKSVAIGVLVATMLAACADDDGGEPAAQGSPTAGSDATATEAPAEGTVAVAESDLGEILVDSEGMTLYVFGSDTGGSSTCYDDCAASWPPLIDEAPTAGEGADESLLGTTERDDGEMQVTYDGHPLYSFASDTAPGDTNGQGVGEVWYVVDTTGKAVTDEEGGGRPGY
jgi:predicted lipoprotein with Yx(FWY)xxD motif